MITIDGVTKRIVLDRDEVSASQIWSAWVDWRENNPQWTLAFRQAGGDSLGGGLYIPPYFFLQSGWKVRPREAHHELKITGNLFTEDGSSPLVNTLGNYNVIAQYTVPVQAQAISISGGGGGSTFDETQLHIALDSYTNKDDWKATETVVDLTPIINAINVLNNISLAQIEGSTVLAKSATLTGIANMIANIPTTDLTPVLNAISGLNDVTPAEVRAAFNAAEFKDKNTELEIHTWLDSYANKASWKSDVTIKSDDKQILVNDIWGQIK